MKKVKAPVLWISGYYDGPLSGAVLLDGEVVWFSMIQDYEPTGEVDDYGDEVWAGRRWGLYRITDEEFRKLVTDHFLFEHYVGTHHCNHSPGAVKDRSTHMQYYDQLDRHMDPAEGKEPFAEWERQ